ncbi:MAG: glycosyltransferase family 2 protein [Candidatus Micrarchaeia archaeon]
MLSAKHFISLIIPTWNEEKNIGKVIEGAKAELDKMGYPYEIIVVDKYSKDKTVEIAKRLGAKVIYDAYGKGSALVKGMKLAKGDILISMDADLSNRPSELKLLVDAIDIGYDVCLGSRFITGGGSEDMPLIRKLGNKFFVMLVNLFFNAHYTDMCYGYRSFAKKAFNKLSLKEKGFGIETEMNIEIAKKRLKAIEVPSFEKKRAHGIGNLKTFRDGYVILKTILKNIFRK